MNDAVTDREHAMPGRLHSWAEVDHADYGPARVVERRLQWRGVPKLVKLY